ncbi:MAG: SDR family oxidoreductase [Proteobacteria bacterium]|nr:SDR family oxidoreductase [Pseudomonadota bacterium]
MPDPSASDKQPPQSQDHQPGEQSAMRPTPETIRDSYLGSGRLKGRSALVTGGDSGIGRAVAVHFAREGADVAIAYLEETDDARETERMIRAEGGKCLLLPGDLGHEDACRQAVASTVEAFGGLDILVNNAAEQHAVDSAGELTAEQVERTFRTNIFAYIYMAKAALEHLPEGGAIINTGSVTGVRGHKTLLDYAATKGAIHAFTFSLAQAYAEQGIRVNAVAPGPIWTPLIPASFPEDKVAQFGGSTLMKRAGQPSELGPAYVFLASEEASFITGQIIHINGGGHISA